MNCNVGIHTTGRSFGQFQEPIVSHTRSPNCKGQNNANLSLVRVCMNCLGGSHPSQMIHGRINCDNKASCILKRNQYGSSSTSQRTFSASSPLFNATSVEEFVETSVCLHFLQNLAGKTKWPAFSCPFAVQTRLSSKQHPCFVRTVLTFFA